MTSLSAAKSSTSELEECLQAKHSYTVQVAGPTEKEAKVLGSETATASLWLDRSGLSLRVNSLCNI